MSACANGANCDLAALPPEALKLYRGRVDPVAKRWYEQGIAERNGKLLQNVVRQAFASSYGDDALMALGEMALESGDYAAARSCWERVADKKGVRTICWRPGPPRDVSVRENRSAPVSLAAVRARLVLVSILEGATDRARAELAELSRLHADARGRLGGREGKYVELLAALLAESGSWPTTPQDPNWPTLAGNAARTRPRPGWWISARCRGGWRAVGGSKPAAGEVAPTAELSSAVGRQPGVCQ